MLTKVDIGIYQQRRDEEEKEIQNKLNIIAEEERIEREKQAEEKRRFNNLPDEQILDDILLIGNRTEKYQDAINFCEEGDAITIDWETEKDEEGFDVLGSMLIVVHDYSGREIGRFKEADQKKLIELGDDYLFDGSIEKIGQKDNGGQFVVIKIIAKKKNKTWQIEPKGLI